jgi:outer membrane receptor for ferrienterochelin and colicins
MTKGACSCLMLLVVSAMNWAAEIESTATKPVDPTEISFAELIKMEVVEAASRFRQPIAEAPSSVTIISSDEVKKYGHRTLADILESVPGLYVSYDRNYSFLGIRGFSLGDFNNRVLLLLNGHRMNNSLSDSAFIGTEFLLDVDLIERVEIIRGPGSSLYGNNAFFGVINVITREGAKFPGHGVEVSGEAGSFDTYKGRVTYGKLFKNGIQVLFSGTIYESEGQDRLFYKEFNTPAQNNGIAEDADTDSFKSVFGSMAFKDFTLEGGFITREKRNPTAQFLTDFNDRRLQTTDDRGYVTLKYFHQFEEIVDVSAKVYYDHHDFEINEPFSGVLYRDAQQADWWGTELQLTKRIQDKHTFTLGGEFRDDFRQEERFFNVTNGVVSRDLHRSRQNHGVYFQGDVAIITNLHLNAGVRYDQYGDFDPTFNPRVALIYNPVDKTIFKAIYGTAFRAPNFFELSDQRNQDIMPETISTYALVYEQGIGKHLRSSVAGFYNQIEDLIAFNSAPGHQRFENLSGAEAKGVEFALEGSWRAIIRGRASYTFQHTEDSDTGRVLTDSPAHLGKLNISVPVWQDKIFAGLEFLYVSSRTTTHLTPLGTAEPGEDAKGYGLVNFTLFSQNLLKNLDLSASIYNILDKHYDDPSTPFHRQDLIEQDGRSFRVKLTYRF